MRIDCARFFLRLPMLSCRFALSGLLLASLAGVAGLAVPASRVLADTTAATDGPAANFSLAINNGRVIDPESGLDAVRHLGIAGNQIVSVAEQPLQAEQVIDASGLVVAPGFIDLHTHSPTPLGQYYQAFDGVTTALELEAGFHPVLGYAEGIASKALINFGASSGHVMARVLEKNGLQMSGGMAAPEPVGLKGWLTALKFMFTDADTALAASLREPADTAELQKLRRQIEADIDDGALGIGLPLDYFSAAIQEAEMRMLFSVAAKHAVPLFIHIRRGIDGDPAGLIEVLDYAREFGVSIHVCHITHSAMSGLDEFLAAIKRARSEGVDVTTEVLPYNAGSAAIGSAVFGRDWLTIFNITYEDVQWAETGARFNRDMWREYRSKYPEGVVIHHYLKEEWTRRAVKEPGVMIVSDLVAMETRDKKVAPHNGAFSKVLGRYVRESGLLDLSTAIGKMTLLPAQRLETFAPLFKRKGRLQPGMDADITVFNARTILDNATYLNPYQEASGIAHVIVGGVPVIQHGKRVEGAYPGRRLLATDK